MFRNTDTGNVLGVRKVSPALIASGRRKSSRRSHYQGKQTSLFWNPGSTGGQFQCPFPMEWTSGLGILAADGPITLDYNPGPSSSYKVTPMPANDVWYLVIL